jgi:hypothetical protein
VISAVDALGLGERRRKAVAHWLGSLPAWWTGKGHQLVFILGGLSDPDNTATADDLLGAMERDGWIKRVGFEPSLSQRAFAGLQRLKSGMERDRPGYQRFEPGPLADAARVWLRAAPQITPAEYEAIYRGGAS